MGRDIDRSTVELSARTGSNPNRGQRDTESGTALRSPGCGLAEYDPVVGQYRPVRAEVPTTGIDEQLQLIGGDPYGHNAGLGLRIPGHVLVNPTAQTSRYLFLLSTFQVPRGLTARIRGYRQYLSLGVNVGSGGEAPFYRIVEQPITQPYWHPLGGNVSWHLQDMGPPGAAGIPSYAPATPPQAKVGAPLGIDSCAFRISTSPALLAETINLVGGYYTNLIGYVPPNGGRPYGVPLIDGGFGSIFDMRTPWNAAEAWQSLDIQVRGPKMVGLFASVRQADPTATGYALPAIGGGAVGYGNGLSPEEQFLVNFPTANYWRIAGSLMVDS